jgi:hypothetical protein
MAMPTLSAAVNVNQNFVILSSLTVPSMGGFTTVVAANPQYGLVCDGEIMVVTKIGSGTQVYVQRGQRGTVAKPHGKGQIVFAAPLNLIPEVTEAMVGLVPTGPIISTVPIGSVAYTTWGTNKTPVAGTLYYASIRVPAPYLATGIAVLNGTTATTDYWLVALFDFAGNLVASSAVAGALVATAAIFQKRDFSPGPVFLAPGIYFVAVQSNGTTATLQTVATLTYLDLLTGSQTGTFGTVPAALTAVPTTLTADVGPIAYLYNY